MYGAEQPRKRVCSSRTMVMKRCEDSDSAGLVSTLLTTASGHVSSRAQRTAVTVVTTVLSSHIYLSTAQPPEATSDMESRRGQLTALACLWVNAITP